MIINKEKFWQSVAKDYNSPFFRNSLWVKSWLLYPKLLNIKAPLFGIMSKQNTIDYIGNHKSFMASHEALKARALNNPRYIESLVQKTEKLGKNLNDWTKKHIFKKDLTKISSTQLLLLYDQFSQKQQEEYAFGTAVAIIDFQGFYFVEDSLRNLLKRKLPKNKIPEAFGLFTQPINNSFSMEQEIAILKLVQKFYSTQFKKDVLTLSKETLSLKYRSFWKQLNTHTRRYAWVYYVYAGPAYSNKEFLDFAKSILSKPETPALQLRNILTNKKKSEVKRKKLIIALKPTRAELQTLQLARMVVWGKPRRKDYQSQSYYHAEKLQLEFGRRLNLSLNQIRSTSPEMLAKWLATGKPNTHLCSQIFQAHVCIPSNKGFTFLYGKKANSYLRRSLTTIKTKINKVSELKGSIAYPGHVKGTVKIINRMTDMAKMMQGDILISAATSPSIIPAIKMASAIITDEGGLTCHAAIVSRELRIPCVIGTKIATKVFKDGDQVKVDAIRGIISKL